MEPTTQAVRFDEYRLFKGYGVPGLYSISEPVLAVLFGLASAGPSQTLDARPALSIRGAPSLLARTNSFYSFTPTVTQRGNRALRFSVDNKPAWLSFGKRHGTLYGTPLAAQAGTYSNIVITVSDGVTTVRLPAFAIDVPPTATRIAARAQ